MHNANRTAGNNNLYYKTAQTSAEPIGIEACCQSPCRAGPQHDDDTVIWYTTHSIPAVILIYELSQKAADARMTCNRVSLCLLQQYQLSLHLLLADNILANKRLWAGPQSYHLIRVDTTVIRVKHLALRFKIRSVLVRHWWGSREWSCSILSAK